MDVNAGRHHIGHHLSRRWSNQLNGYVCQVDTRVKVVARGPVCLSLRNGIGDSLPAGQVVEGDGLTQFFGSLHDGDPRLERLQVGTHAFTSSQVFLHIEYEAFQVHERLQQVEVLEVAQKGHGFLLEV